MKVDIGERIAACFPIGAPPVQLTLEPSDVDAEDGDDVPRAVATIRLIVWDVGPETTSIRDIKEQVVFMGFPALYDDAGRVGAFFAALGDVLADISVDVIDGLMPHDILLADVLELKRASTREDFSAALRAKSRLGKHLQA